MERLSPIGWAIRPLKRYAEFSGRSSRAEFWWFFLFATIFYAAVTFLLMRSVASMVPSQPSDPANAVNFANSGMGILMSISGLLWLALLCPMIAVQVRRLHDLNRSGWWIGGFWLLYLAYLGLTFSMVVSGLRTPGAAAQMGGFAAAGIVAISLFVYSIVLLVFFCLRGTTGANRYGDDPYGVDVEQVFA
jgi:uncharacterized membrane protein YhaH (DUF805 family)